MVAFARNITTEVRASLYTGVAFYDVAMTSAQLNPAGKSGTALHSRWHANSF